MRVLSIKWLAVVAIVALGVSACSKMEASTTVIDVPTAACGSCEKNITTALKAVDGVKNVNFDLKAKKATITYAADKTTVEALEMAVVNAGYQANEKIANKEAYDKLDACCQAGYPGEEKMKKDMDEHHSKSM